MAFCFNSYYDLRLLTTISALGRYIIPLSNLTWLWFQRLEEWKRNCVKIILFSFSCWWMNLFHRLNRLTVSYSMIYDFSIIVLYSVSLKQQNASCREWRWWHCKKKPPQKTHKKHYGSPSINKANLTILSDIFSIKYVF